MSFSINLSHKGKTVSIDGITGTTTGEALHKLAYEALDLSPEEFTLKLLLRGKQIPFDGNSTPVFSAPAATTSTKIPKILVMSSARTSVEELNSKKQDPTIRGFDQEKKTKKSNSNGNGNNDYWGDLSQPHKDYKFGRLRECPFHEFGHRPTDTTPHAFAAKQLLERLSTDPGIVAILKERQLVVGTLGEMDPIDDRIMQKQQNAGSCLLGYNTNRGLRIDIKLRTDDLKGFRPYPELVATLIHELSHNWVGEHNTLFWANFGQMRIEYLIEHKRLQYQLWKGKTSAELAQLPIQIFSAAGTTAEGGGIMKFVHDELIKDMAQHQLHPRMIEQPLQQRYDELQSTLGQRLGGGRDATGGGQSGSIPPAAAGGRRNMALEAAERRAREQQKQQQQQQQQEKKENP